MKKIILLIAFISAFIAAKAQYSDAVLLTSITGYYGDTVTNTATKYLYYTNGLSAPQLKGVLHTSAIAITVTKISGTVAGTISVEGSLDGVNYYNVYNSHFAGSDISNYNYTATDVSTQTFRFAPPFWADLYLRVKYTGAGNMSAKVEAKLFARKEVH